MPQPTPKKPAGTKKPAGQTPDVMHGDHVFAQHPARGPIAVRVTAVGKDGFRGVCDKNEKHGIPFDAYLGHKARAVHRFEVLDEGADGTIVQDTSGRSRFITGPLPQPEAPGADGKQARAKPDDPLIDGLGHLAKAFEASDDMHIPDGARLFLKAGGPIANKAGLALKETTDKLGHQTHRWQSTAAPGGGDGKGGGDGTMKHGDTVSFQHGKVQGQGKIVGSGADGVTLEGEGGREHKVRHEHLTGPAGDGKQPASEEKSGGGKPGDDGRPKPFFDEKETADLPKKATQPTKDRAELFKQSEVALDHLQTWLDRGKGIASQAGAETMKKGPGDVKPEEWDKPGAMLFIAKLKGAERAAEKVDSDYGGDWSKLTDTVRGSIAVDTIEDMHGMVARLKAGGMKLAQQPKDRFAKPTAVGYRDMLLNITLPNGLVGELQLHVKSMLKAKNEGHAHYETERTLDGKEKRGETLSDAEKATLKAAQDKQTEIYNGAWEGANRVSGGAGDNMAKAMGGEGGEFSFFEHDGAHFRRKNGGFTRSVDDVLHEGKWKPYKGADALAPALYGDEVADPCKQGEGDGEPMAKAIGGLRLLLPAAGADLTKALAAPARKETLHVPPAPVAADPAARPPAATSGGIWRLLLTSFRRGA